MVKLRYLTILVTHYIKKFILRINTNDLELDERRDDGEENVMSRFIMDSIIYLLSGSLIETTYFMVINELDDFEGFNETGLSYVDVIYFTIVSFSTIGYGKIYPVTPFARFATTISLIVNITVMSTFVGKLIDFLF